MAESAPTPADDAALMRTRFQACVSAESKWRLNALQDLKFKAGTDGTIPYQWDEAAVQERRAFSQPMFTVNRMDAFIKQVTNQYRLSGPTMHVAPVGEDGDEDTAEIFEGVIRHIMAVSDGEIAVDTAFEAIATHGIGYVDVMPTYLDEDTNTQELVVTDVRNPFTHYLDPGAVKPDRSDMRFAFKTQVISSEECEARHGADSLASATDLASIGDSQRVTWYPDGAIRLVEYFELVTSRTKKGRQKILHVRWRKMNGAGKVLGETKLPITRIPIVPFFGDEYDLDGEIDHRGMVRNGRDPQRILNWTFTYLIEQLSVAPRAPFLVSATQIENFENIWKLANVRNFPYLPYNDKDADGRPTGQPPIRNSIEPPIQSTVAALLMAENQFKAVMQLYDPSLGQRKTDQSGKAVLALQQQGEIGNSNYSDNAKRGLRSLGRLLVMMIPKYYDAPRVLRILGRDEQPRTVMIHANKDAQIPTTLPKGLDPSSIYNLGAGRYDVVVTTGPNFVNKQQEQLATLLDLTKADPAIVPIVADLIAKKMGADDVVERLRKIEPLKSLLAQDAQQGPTVEQVQQKLGMVLQQNDVLIKELDAKNELIETDTIKMQGQALIKRLELESRERIAHYQGEVELAITQAKLAGTLNETALKGRLDHMEAVMTKAHEANEAATDRAHASEEAGHDRSAASELVTQQALLTPSPSPNGEGA
jgi:hypothetical protein